MCTYPSPSLTAANRDPKGALFVVDGEAKRVDQAVGEDITVAATIRSSGGKDAAYRRVADSR